MPYRITQRYLPHGRGDILPQLIKLGSRFRDPDGMQMQGSVDLAGLQWAQMLGWSGFNGMFNTNWVLSRCNKNYFYI